MISTSLKDMKRNSCTRGVTKLKDITEAIAELKWNYARHIAGYQ